MWNNLRDNGSYRVFFWLWFVLLPAALALLLAGIFRCAAADAVPDARAGRAAGYLAQFGWRVDEASCETAEVAIPREFGAVYERYNALQRAQGLDLSPYRGAVLTRFTFTVVNAPEEADGGPVLANVFFSGEAVVAADLCAVGLNGFIRGVGRSPQPDDPPSLQ